MIKIAVIGGGPAGLMAAGQAALRGFSVTLFERNARCARKLLITGKGRCNVTNATFDINDLIESIPTNGRFLYRAFSSFMPYDTIDFFAQQGVETKIERGNRVFPTSDKAMDVVDAMVNFAKKCGVNIVNTRVRCVMKEEGSITSVVLEGGQLLPFDALILATGGKSYPLTGSTGDGYTFARALGHTITPIKASLVPINVQEPWCAELQGLSLKNTGIHIIEEESKKEIYSDFGEMLFTHFGVTGPMILSASAHLKNLESHQYQLVIDLKPALSIEQLERRVLRDLTENANRDFSNSLGALLPSKLVPVVVHLSEIPPTIKCNQITKEMRQTLVYLLKHLKLTLTSFRNIAEAIVTSGGVKVSEIEPKTMQSKIINNLYFAGEVIDVDGYTGGFNLQIAFATGYLAGTKIWEEQV